MCVYAFLFLGAGLVAGDMPTAAEQKASKQFQGTWAMVSLHVDGKPAAAREVRANRLVIDGYRWVWFSRGAWLEGIYKLDPTRKRKTIDLTFSIGLDEGKILQGIYKLDGDKLTVCLPHLGAERPKEFAAKRGFDLSVWKRVKR